MITDLTTQERNRAKRLAILFTEEALLPSRFKPGYTGKGKAQSNSKLEGNFQECIREWEGTILQMKKEGMNEGLYERLVYLKLDEEDPATTVAENNDFREQLRYLAYRRDECECPYWELGKLVMLMGEYQRILEKAFKKSLGLKNELAQELLESGEIEIDGIHIKLWQGHTRDTVAVQQDWNRVKGLAEQNQYTTSESSRVVFTGLFQINRAEIHNYASQLGFFVQSNVNGKTETLVIGTENVSPTKIADFIQRRQKGQKIELMEENAFLQMVLESGVLIEK